MSYQLVLDIAGTNRDRCGGVTGEREAIEFAVRNSSRGDAPWIPLRISFHGEGADSADRSDDTGGSRGRSDSHSADSADGTEGISSAYTISRGYSVPAVGRLDAMITEHVNICGDLLQGAREVQFRWMGTAELKGKERQRSDIWALASVSATLFVGNETVEIFRESFGGSDIK